MEKVDELNYQLAKPNSVNTGMLSFKEILGKVFSNTKTKSYFIMIIALILISIISVIAVGDIMTVQKDDIKELLVEDSNIVRYDFEMKEYSRARVFQLLKKYEGEKQIIKFDTGVYYIPRITRFGLSNISVEQVVKIYFE